MNNRMFIAARKGQKDVVESFIGKGADINAKNNYNSTLLHYAASNGWKDLVEFIIEKGANVDSKNKNN